MSCNACGTKFNFFHKEMGCPSCGLSYCSKCLKQKCKIPNKGNVDQTVCKICYNKFSAGSSQTEVTNIQPPEAYLNLKDILSTSPNSVSYDNNLLVLLRRLENLENPSNPPITIYQNSKKFQKLRSGLSPADLQILDRLEKLREDKNKVPPPSDTEIRKRLANLKGENPYVEAPIQKSFTPDTRSNQQKIDSLLEQFENEREIELANNPQEGIEARLASLRNQGVRPNESNYITNLHDSSSSEEEIDKITKKIMDEVALDEKCLNNITRDNEEMDTSESPELPWCVLCNKDGNVRCLDCGNDIYCNKCCKEIHKEFGETDHRITPFKLKENTE